MKRVLLLLVVGFLVELAPLAASDGGLPSGISAQLGLGPYWGYGGGFNLQGGVDAALAQVSVLPKTPVELGVSGRVGVFGPRPLDLAAFGTVRYHWKFLGSKWTWLNSMETYAGLGLQLIPDLSLAGYFGAAYHFDPRWSLFIEAMAVTYGGTALGVSYQF